MIENQDNIKNFINLKKSDIKIINVFDSYLIEFIEMIEILVI